MTYLIAGGGLAGAAAAILLGPEATLVEREPAPHDKICGEFISWETRDALHTLGIDPAALGAAPIDAVRLIHDRTLVRTPLPGRGWGLSRRILDESLLSRAAADGATILRGHTIRRLVPGGLETDRLGRLEATRTLLATGKHDLRGARRTVPAALPQDLVGFKMFYRLAPAQAASLAAHVEVILFPGGYAGLQPVEAGLANLCLLINRTTFDAAGGTWHGVVAHLLRTTPHLATRLDGAHAHLDRPLTISRVPYGFIHVPNAETPPGVFRIGDQMGVIPSFSGDGMSIALHTAIAAVHFARTSTPEAYHRRMQAGLRPQIGRAMVLHRLGQSHPRLIATAARLWPGALAWIARLTRLSHHQIHPAPCGIARHPL